MYAKKLFLSFILGSTALHAVGSSQYVGVVFEGGYDLLKQERSKAENVDIDPIVYGAKLNLGIDSGEELRTNIFFGLQYFDSDLYGYEIPEGSDTATMVGSTNQLLYSIGLDIIKTYSTKGSSILPYLKGGVDYEFMQLDGYAQSWANNVGLSFGGGTFLRMSESLEWQLGAYYKYRMWGNYNLDTLETKNVELSDHSLMLELGLNFHY
ncbi:MAG: hypothetical protein ABFR02_09900 [Campylobacterota bacterium]